MSIISVYLPPSVSFKSKRLSDETKNVWQLVLHVQISRRWLVAPAAEIAMVEQEEVWGWGRCINILVFMPAFPDAYIKSLSESVIYS